MPDHNDESWWRVKGWLSLKEIKAKYHSDTNLLLMIKDAPTRSRNGVVDRSSVIMHLPGFWVPLGLWVPTFGFPLVSQCSGFVLRFGPWALGLGYAFITFWVVDVDVFVVPSPTGILRHYGPHQTTLSVVVRAPRSRLDAPSAVK